MSSSSRDHATPRRVGRAAAILFALVCGAASAQQVVFIPELEAWAQYDTNRLLSTVNPQSAETYWVNVAADMKRITQRSDLEFRPQLTLQESTISSVNRWEALADLKGDYRTLRSIWSIMAEYHREDSFNAQYGVAGFNPLNPNQPDTVGTGTIVTGLTKDTYSVMPGLVYQATQRFSVEALARLDAVRYDVEVPNEYISYNSTLAEIDGYWSVSTRSQIGFGPYYSLYDPEKANSAPRVEGYGLNLSYRFNWSRLDRSTLSLRAEHDDFTQSGTPDQTKNTYGIEWVGRHKFQTGMVQYAIGRFLEPSSVGSLVGLNQVRVQYRHDFSVRTQFVGMVRVSRSDDLSDSSHEDRALLQVALVRRFTELWSVSGGYRFAYQKLSEIDAGQVTTLPSAHNNGVFINFSYRGREPDED
jgi:hypothetical protein